MEKGMDASTNGHPDKDADSSGKTREVLGYSFDFECQGEIYGVRSSRIGGQYSMNIAKEGVTSAPLFEVRDISERRLGEIIEFMRFTLIGKTKTIDDFISAVKAYILDAGRGK